jgi:hypothetical protein
MPPASRAGVNIEVAHYLKAIQAAGGDDADKVVAELRKMKINDFMTTDGWLREDGRVMRDMYLEEVKSPAESKYPFDYFKILATFPADQAFRPLKKRWVSVGPRLNSGSRDRERPRGCTICPIAWWRNSRACSGRRGAGASRPCQTNNVSSGRCGGSPT